MRGDMMYFDLDSWEKALDRYINPDFYCPANGPTWLERKAVMYYCEICEFATSTLWHIQNGSYHREVCEDCYQAFIESEADYLELQMEDR